MKERIYLVREAEKGWVVSHAGMAFSQTFPQRDKAIAAASRAAAKSRAQGCYAWIKVRSTDTYKLA